MCSRPLYLSSKNSMVIKTPNRYSSSISTKFSRIPDPINSSQIALLRVWDGLGWARIMPRILSTTDTSRQVDGSVTLIKSELMLFQIIHFQNCFSSHHPGCVQYVKHSMHHRNYIKHSLCYKSLFITATFLEDQT